MFPPPPSEGRRPGSRHGHGHRTHGTGWSADRGAGWGASGPGGRGGPGAREDGPGADPEFRSGPDFRPGPEFRPGPVVGSGPDFGPDFGVGPSRQFGPGFGRGFGPGSGPGAGPASRFRRGRGGRVPRGDVRAAVLLLLAEQPMHGYQLMQAIRERSGGRWMPSPGAIYPTLSQLEDEGLVTVTADAGRRLATLTDTGRDAVAGLRGAGTDPLAGASAGAPDLRGPLEEVHGAARQLARSGSDAQLAAAVDVLAQARRALYLLLADGPDAPPAPSTD